VSSVIGAFPGLSAARIKDSVLALIVVKSLI
jgi:hypothetical protein